MEIIEIPQKLRTVPVKTETSQFRLFLIVNLNKHIAGKAHTHTPKKLRIIPVKTKTS